MNGRWISYCLFLFTASLHALPKGGHVASGSGSLRLLDEKRLEIKTGEKTHLRWDDFSIGLSELVRFVQPGKGSVVLNQVMGGNPSEIFGTLEANGKVYLINPNGILIGKEGVINVGSFVASTLDILQGNPLDNEDVLFSGKGKIVHLGKVTAWDGDVVFLASALQVEGEMAAPRGSVDLGVGREIFFAREGDERLFVRLPASSEEEVGLDQGGVLSALQVELKAQGNPYALAIRHSGRIDALQTEERGGRVFLVAEGGKAEVAGEIVASGGDVRVLGDEVGILGSALIDVSGKNGGGTVLIGGDFQGSNPQVLNARRTVVEEGAHILGDALEVGRGGRLFVWSKEATGFYGSASVRGGIAGGDGGIVALLGDRHFDFRGSADRRAPAGKAGTLILDPSNITISEQIDANVPLLAPFHPISLSVASVLGKQTLLKALDEGDVIVQSAGGKGKEAGDVIVATPLLYDSDFGLTLRSFVPGVFSGDVLINHPIENRGSGPLVLDAARDIQVCAPITMQSVEGITMTSGKDVHFDHSITTLGPLNVNAIGEANLRAPLCAEGGIAMASKGKIDLLAPVTASGSGISMSSGKEVLVRGSLESKGAGGVRLSGGGNIDIGDSASVHSLGGGVSIVTTHGDISISGAGTSIVADRAPITINATDVGHVIHLGKGAQIATGQGAISLWSGGSIQLSDAASVQTLSGNMRLRSRNDVQMSGAASQLRSEEGNITVTANNLSLKGGASIENGSKGITITVENLTLQGEDAMARIHSRSGKVNINTTNDLTLRGGEGADAFAEISSQTGNVAFNIIGGNLLLEGGVGENTYAQIGSVAGDIVFYSAQGDVTLKGGGASSACAKINSSLGSISFPEEGIEGALLLEGTDARAEIGSGNNLIISVSGEKGVTLKNEMAALASSGKATLNVKHTLHIDEASAIGKGDMNIAADHLLMNGGSIESREGNLTLQFRGADFGLEVPVHVAAPEGDLFVKTTEACRLQGGDLLAGKEMTIRSLGTLTVQALTDATIASAFGNVELNASGDMTFSGTEKGVAAVRNYSGDSITAVTSGDLTLGYNALFENTGWGELNAFADRDLKMQSNARLAHFGRGVLATAAGRDMLLSQETRMNHFGTGNLFIVSGRHTTMLDQFSAETLGGKLTVVVDHFLPGHPVIGDGSFTKGSHVTLSSQTGSVVIYTARRSQNQIEGPINGALFIPGEAYMDSDTERWFTFFHEDVKTALDFFWVYAEQQALPIFLTAAGSSSGAPPYAIYYKDGRGVVRRQTPINTTSVRWKSAVSKSNRIARAESEALRDIRVLSEFLYVPRRFLVGYEGATLDSPDSFFDPSSSFDLMLDEYETILLRQYRTYHTKKLLGWDVKERKSRAIF